MSNFFGLGGFLKELYVFTQSQLVICKNSLYDVILDFQNKQICCFGSFLK